MINKNSLIFLAKKYYSFLNIKIFFIIFERSFKNLKTSNYLNRTMNKLIEEFKKMFVLLNNKIKQ